MHYDPYDATQVFVRTPDGWVTRALDAPADGRPRRSPSSPGATPAAWPPQTGGDDTNETEVARVLDDLLTRAAGRAGRQAQRPDRRPHPRRRGRAPAAADATTPRRRTGDAGRPADEPDGPPATVIPFGVFDADAEAERW